MKVVFRVTVACVGLLLALLLIFGFAPGLLTKGIEVEVKKIVYLVKPEINDAKQLDIVAK